MKSFTEYITESITDSEQKLYKFIIQDMKKNGYEHVNADDYIYNKSLQKLLFPDAKRDITNKLSRMIHILVKKGYFSIVKKSEVSSSDTTYSKFGHHKTGTIHTTSTSFIIKPIGK